LRLGVDGKVISDSHFVFYNNKIGSGGGIEDLITSYRDGSEAWDIRVELSTAQLRMS
jgi:hypothetical protein